MEALQDYNSTSAKSCTEFNDKMTNVSHPAEFYPCQYDISTMTISMLANNMTSDLSSVSYTMGVINENFKLMETLISDLHAKVMMQDVLFKLLEDALCMNTKMYESHPVEYSGMNSRTFETRPIDYPDSSEQT